MKTYKVIVDNQKTIHWYKYDEAICHREDGPAVEYANGDKYWYLSDKQLSKKEFNRQTNKDNCNNKIVEIDGKKYKLILV